MVSKLRVCSSTVGNQSDDSHGNSGVRCRRSIKSISTTKATLGRHEDIILHTSSPIIRHQEISADAGMVVAQHLAAAQIGVEVMQRGGNAVDAAVTGAFAIGVLLPMWNGIGGGGVMVVHMADGSGGSVDFGMQAAGLAHAEMYELEDELVVMGPSRRFSWPKVKNNANMEGYTSISIPGTVAGLTTTLEKWGTIDLDQAVAPAIKLAREGFALPRTMALALAEKHELLSRFPTTAAVYLNNGSPMSTGSNFVQTEYAETLERLGRVGASDMYGGETGARIAEDIEKNGGYLRLSDFEQYTPIVHDLAMSGTYRGLDVSGVGGPCGGPPVFEILNILNSFDLAAMEHGSADFLHTMIESVKLASVDRFSFMGDPAIYGFPIDVLADPEYAKSRAKEIDSASAQDFSAGDPWPYAGVPKPADFPAPGGIAPDDGTTHLTTADKSGNMVALTQTNVAFSGVLNPGVGVMMNDAMSWSVPVPGTVNSIAPHARALNNMTPVIVHENGRAVIAIGGSGGRRIWPGIVQMIVNRVDFGMGLQEALEQPRFHVESDVPVIDPRFGEQVLADLKNRGHNYELPPKEFVIWPFSEPNGIVKDAGVWKSGLTPLFKPTHAAGY
jgi:gamma-glutamyltranspeptidase/glutathione hydrolase